MTAIHAFPTLPLLRPHVLAVLIAIWPVLFVMPASFDFPADESMAVAGSLSAQQPYLFSLHHRTGPPSGTSTLQADRSACLRVVKRDCFCRSSDHAEIQQNSLHRLEKS